MKKHKISGIETGSYMNSRYESNASFDGMHVLDARPNEYGEPTDTYMSSAVEKLERQDELMGSAVVSLVNVEAA